MLPALILVLSLLVVPVAGPPDPDPGGPGPGGPDPGGPVVTYRPPVEAPVVDPFRAPPNPYAAGNRGIEYATVPGTPVGAVADGVVTFAGPVAGTLHVTVLHADGIRTSYSFLDRVGVVVGQRVRRGQPVGLAGGRFHLGARTGPRRYIDPAQLWSGRWRARLVPVGGGPAPGPDPPGELGRLAAGPEPVAGLAGGSAEVGASAPLR